MVKFLVHVLVVAMLLTGCSDAETEASPDTRDLTVTFVVGAMGSPTSCGAYDQRTLALEDGSGTLLVPATGFTASDLLDNDDPAMPAEKVCHYTAVLTDVADADVYQLVYSSEGQQFRGGYRRAELDEADWQLVGIYDELIRQRS